MKVEQATEWLLAHSGDKDFNDPLPLETEDPVRTDGDNNNSTEQSDRTTATQDSSRVSPSGDGAPEGAADSTSDIGASGGAGASATSDDDLDKEYTPQEALQVFREFRNRPRKPPPETVGHILFYNCFYISKIYVTNRKFSHYDGQGFCIHFSWKGRDDL